MLSYVKTLFFVHDKLAYKQKALQLQGNRAMRNGRSSSSKVISEIRRHYRFYAENLHPNLFRQKFEDIHTGLDCC